jgi:hypothetical protein
MVHEERTAGSGDAREGREGDERESGAQSEEEEAAKGREREGGGLAGGIKKKKQRRWSKGAVHLKYIGKLQLGASNDLSTRGN